MRDDEQNLYRYVGNNPVNAIDPSGLEIIFSGKPPARNEVIALWNKIKNNAPDELKEKIKEIEESDKRIKIKIEMNSKVPIGLFSRRENIIDGSVPKIVET